VRLSDAVCVAVSVPLPVEAAVPAAVREGEADREAVLEGVGVEEVVLEGDVVFDAVFVAVPERVNGDVGEPEEVVVCVDVGDRVGEPVRAGVFAEVPVPVEAAVGTLVAVCVELAVSSGVPDSEGVGDGVEADVPPAV